MLERSRVFPLSTVWRVIIIYAHIVGGCRLGVLLCTELKCKTHYIIYKYVECLFCRAVAAAQIYAYTTAAVVGTGQNRKDHATASV